MKRRDFLRFRTDTGKQVAELSCEKLFVHYEGLCSGFHQAPEEAGTIDDEEWWAGEPPLAITSIDPDDFFRGLLTDLKGVDTLKVLDIQWLSQGEFRIRVDTLLAAFKATGSEIIYPSHSLEPSP
ncbi:MAG: hypothetical protein JKY98_11240 [Gammaproteobacteria bacterium]|nr:hypothetical protein [Gammaproteobacteria bacterium]